ncbi:MAG: ASCH domain-containing protein [Acidimicrobiales bacterium]
MSANPPHLPEPNADEVDAFWDRYLAAAGLPDDTPFDDVGSFGDTVEMADELLELVLTGTKRATASAVAEYESEQAPMPEVGDEWIACDGAGTPVAVIRTIEVEVAPLSSVDDEFAFDEGEGDRSREYWLEVHTRFFERTYRALGLDFHAEISVVFERFEVVYDEDWA